MATKSGKDGKVLIGLTELAAVTSWKLSTFSHNPALASSSSDGTKTRYAGVKDSSGSIQFKLDFTDPITDDFEEGATVTLKLHLNDTQFYTVPAIIDAIDFDSVDIDGGKTIGGVARFSGTGPITKPTY